MRRIFRLTRAPSIPALMLGGFLALLYIYFFALKAHVEFKIQFDHPGRAWFKVYWAEPGQDYAEARMRRVLIDGKKKTYDLFIGNLSSIERIRIDPIEFEYKLFLYEITISQPGFADIEINPENGFAGLEPINDIDNVVVKEDGLRFNTTGRDSQFELVVDKAGGYLPLVHVFTVLAIVFGTMLAGRALAGLGQELRFVPALLLIAVILALTMAAISKHYWLHPNGTARLFVHPDEEAHVAAVEYYRDHWLPPAIDDPAIADSFSVYGYTRLASYELYYPIAGYLTRLLVPLRQAFMWDARLVSVLLFALMAFFAWRYTSFRPFAAPLLISPQIWYLYSYTNSDGFALFLATMMAWQAADRESVLNRMLTEPARPHWFPMTWLGLLVGALLLLKLNFYFFILFLGLYLFWRIACGDFPDKKLLFTRLAIIAFISVAVYVGRYGLEIAANGSDSKQKITAMIEEKAEPLYKPSTELGQQHIYLQMRERGHSLGKIWFKEKWGGKTFVSAFGAYGFTQYLGGKTYYDLVTWTGIALILVMLASLLLRGPPSSWFLFGITGGCAVLLIAASLYNSWTVSFQAQGRYMAPILPMLGVLYYHSRPWLIQRLFNPLLFALFGISVWSFVFIGLALIPKLP